MPSAKLLDDLRSPLRFLLGHTELAKELDHLTAAPVEGGYSLSGTPKGLAKRVNAVILLVDSKGVIRTLEIQEVDGARTTFTFTDMQENVAAPDSEFRSWTQQHHCRSAAHTVTCPLSPTGTEPPLTAAIAYLA